MASELFLSNAQVEAQATAIASDATGFGGSQLTIFTATKPANANTVVTTQIPLVTFVLPTIASGDLVVNTPAGVITVADNIIADSLAYAAGTAAWFRVTAVDGIAAQYNLTITAPDTTDGGSIDITLPGAGAAVNVVIGAAASITDIAAAIYAARASFVGWTLTNNDPIINFLRDCDGAVTGAASVVLNTTEATAAFATVAAGSGTVVCDGTVDTANADLLLNSTVVTLGANVEVTNFTYTVTP